jgi:hypothetical protein
MLLRLASSGDLRETGPRELVSNPYEAGPTIHRFMRTCMPPFGFLLLFAGKGVRFLAKYPVKVQRGTRHTNGAGQGL